MEATTLDSTVASLLSPEVGGEPTQEDNLRDAADDMIEPTQDAESEIVEEAEEDADVVEASDDDGEGAEVDDETEYTDEVEAVEDNSEALFDVTINGKKERWTLSQLQQSAAGQGYIQQKMRENAEQAKQLEAAEAQLAQQQQHVEALFIQMQQGGFNMPQPPSKELLATDPIGYMQEKEAYEEAMQSYNANLAQMQQMQQQRNAQTQEELNRYRQEQMAMLQQRVPDFADSQKFESAIKEMVRGGQEYYGVPEEALMNLRDAVEVEILYDAIRYRKLQANRKNIDKKAKQAKPMVKSGSKKVEDGKVAIRKRQEAKAKKTGDWTDLLIDPNLS